MVTVLLLVAPSFSVMFAFGECDFNRLRFGGQYGCGYKEFRLPKLQRAKVSGMLDLDEEIGGNLVSVFYPMDMTEFRTRLASRYILWLRHRFKSRLGFAKAVAEYGSESHAPPWIFKVF